MGNKPYREKDSQRPFADIGVGDQHNAAHYAQNSGDKRQRRPKAGKAGKPDIDDNVLNAYNNGDNTVDYDRSGQHAFRAGKGEDAKQYKKHAD